MDKKNIQKIILISIAVKFSYYLFVYILSIFSHERLEIKTFGDHFLQNYINNDSGYYETIAESGYPDPDEVSDQRELLLYAFFPLYPKSASLLIHVFGFDTRVAFFILTTLFSISAFIIFYLFTSSHTGNKTLAFYATLVLMVFPHHYYFSMFYTESLFLLLAVLSFYFIQRNKLIYFSISSSLLVLTRINGIVIMLPLLLYYIAREKDSIFSLLRNPRKYLPFLAMPFMFFVYCLVLKIETGYFFAFKKYAEEGWGESPTFPLSTLYHTLLGDHQWFYKYNAFYAIFFLLLSFYFIYKKDWSFFVFAWLVILVPLYEGSTVAQPRYISVIFPFSLLFGSLVSKFRFPWAILLLLFTLHMYTYSFWAITDPLSY